MTSMKRWNCIGVLLAGLVTFLLMGFAVDISAQDDRVTVRKDGKLVATADLSTGVVHAMGFAKTGLADWEQRIAAERDARSNLFDCVLRLKGKVDQEGLVNSMRDRCYVGPCMREKNGSLRISLYMEIPHAYLPKGGQLKTIISK